MICGSLPKLVSSTAWLCVGQLSIENAGPGMFILEIQETQSYEYWLGYNVGNYCDQSEIVCDQSEEVSTRTIENKNVNRNAKCQIPHKSEEIMIEKAIPCPPPTLWNGHLVVLLNVKEVPVQKEWRGQEGPEGLLQVALCSF